jgi:AraC-like DNA-binding protein
MGRIFLSVLGPGNTLESSVSKPDPHTPNDVAEPRQATIAGIVVLGLLKALERTGLEPAPLCRAVELDAASLEDPNARVPTGRLVRLLALAEQRALDPWIGLHAGEHVEPRSPLFHMMQSSTRVAEALQRARRFSGLLIDTLRIAVRTERKLASLIFEPGDATFSASRHAVEYLVMASASAMRHAVGDSCPRQEVQFRHHRIGSLDEAERAFGCPVYFGQPDDRVIFARSALWAVPKFANRSVAEQVERFAETLDARIAARATTGERAEQAARALLASGIRASGASVARKLGTTSRSLQRRLAEEGTSFRALRDGVLWEAVEESLSNPSLKIEAIALSVGFSDVAAFSKAFRRWKGYPPTRYREALGKSEGLADSPG